MFSRIYKSARALLIDTPQIGSIASSQKIILDETMVTTRPRNRAAPAEEALNEESSINVYVPIPRTTRGQTRARIEDKVDRSNDETVATPVRKKRKILPVREKDVDTPNTVKTIPVVEVPARKVTPEPDFGQEVVSPNPSESLESPDEEQEASQEEIDTKSKHRRFGSEEQDEQFFSTAREVIPSDDDPDIEAGSEDESEDSEDDAPEAIGIQEAAKDVRSKERDTAKALKE